MGQGLSVRDFSCRMLRMIDLGDVRREGAHEWVGTCLGGCGTLRIDPTSDVIRKTKHTTIVDCQMVPWKRILTYYTDVLRGSERFEAFMFSNNWFLKEDDFESDLRNKRTYEISIKQELQYITDGITRRPPGKHFADDDYILAKLSEIDRRLGKMRFHFEYMTHISS